MDNKNIIRFLKKNRDFRFLWIGQMISQLGDAINWMASLGFIAMVMPGIGASLLLIWLMIPIVTIGPFAGVWVDRFRRKNTMLIADITRGILVLLFIFVLSNYVSVKNQETSFKISNEIIKKSGVIQSELISKKAGNIEGSKAEFYLNKIGSEFVIMLKKSEEQSDNIEISIVTDNDDYEKISLKKNGEFYSGTITAKSGYTHHKKNKILEYQNNEHIKLNVSEKKGPIFIVFFVTFIISIITQFFVPAKSAMIPEIVEKDELVYANSLSASAGRVVIIIGGALGGFIIGKYGIKAALFFDFITTITSFISISFIREKRHVSIKDINNSEEINKSVISDLKEAYIYISKKPVIIFSLFSYISIMIAGGLSYIFLIKFSNETLRMGVEGLGYLQTSLGVGVVIGAVILGIIGNKISKISLIKIGLLIVATSAAMFGCIEKINFAILTGIVAGIGGALIIIISETILQIVVKSHFRGRIFGLLQTITNASFAISAIIAGFFSGVIEERVLFFSLAVIFVILLIINQIVLFVRRNYNGN